jgi:hypothetical protein
MKALSILSVASLVTLTGCMHAPIHGGSYNNNAGVPVQEIGARAAVFAGQAQQFHQATQAISLCPNGTKSKKGGGSVNSGVGDQNGKVTYSVTTQSGNSQECNFAQ